jgi:methyl-accepting chemotaxis protein
VRSITFKVIALCLASCTAVGLILGGYLVYLNRAEAERSVARVDGLRRKGFDQLTQAQVETAVSMLSAVAARRDHGELNPEQARKLAADLLRELRYGGEGYFFADTTDGTNVVLLGRDAEGKNRDGALDAKGNPFIRNLRAAAVGGGGFTEWWFPKKGKPEPFPKRGYARISEPFGWVVGTGNYLDEVDAAVAEERKVVRAQSNRQLLSIIVIIFGSLVVVLMPAVYLGRRLSRPIVRLRDATALAARGDLSIRLGLQTRDEVGELARAFDGLADRLQAKASELEKVSNGDLTVRIEVASQADTLGRAAERMVKELQRLIRQVHQAAAQVAESSREIAGASETLSGGATQQASAIQEITASVTEVGAQIRSNAESAAEADELVATAKEAAASGDRRMKAMVAAMQELSSSSGQISKIIQVIDAIAFQTNLLALNAAVESARAGRHGKGFAVVAEEVRTLAGRSAKAARETAELIGASGDRVQKGLTLAREASETFDTIVESVSSAASLISRISASSREQSTGVEQISQGLNQIDGVTQRNAAGAEQTASAARELAASAQEVRQLLHKFELDGGGAGGELEPGEAASVRPDPRHFERSATRSVT